MPEDPFPEQDASNVAKDLRVLPFSVSERLGLVNSWFQPGETVRRGYLGSVDNSKIYRFFVRSATVFVVVAQDRGIARLTAKIHSTGIEKPGTTFSPSSIIDSSSPSGSAPSR